MMKQTKNKINKIKRSPLRKLFLSSLGLISLILISYYCYSWFESKNNIVAIIDGISTENKDKIKLETEIRALVQGYPIETMVPYIVEKDPKVAAFLVSIAKKESNFGKRSPVMNGQDCYNYWGFRETRAKMGTGGHTCFNDPKDAVDTVAGRIEKLIQAEYDTPREMIVWKCGYSCDGHSAVSVQKWISDVSLFFKKIDK